MIRPDTLAFNTLATMARQRLGLEESSCVALLSLLTSSALLDAALRHQLEEAGLTDSKFGVLVVLFNLHPRATCPADLAAYTGYTRSSISDAVHELHAAGYVAVDRATDDARNVEVRLTARGRQSVDTVATAYLQSLATVTRSVAAGSAAELRRLAAHFATGVAHLAPSALPVRP